MTRSNPNRVVRATSLREGLEVLVRNGRVERQCPAPKLGRQVRVRPPQFAGLRLREIQRTTKTIEGQQVADYDTSPFLDCP